MSHGKRRWGLLIGLISVFIVVLPAVLVLQRRAGIHATVENSGGYFEPGDRGTISVSIRDGQIDTNEQNTRSWQSSVESVADSRRVAAVRFGASLYAA